MEEKERYENRDGIYDTTIDDYVNTDILVNLLNQQDKRIKELEQETYPAYKREHQRRAYLENIEIPKLKERIKELKEENQQLKQQLEDTEESYNNTMRYLNKTRSELLNLPKKILGEIKDCLLDFSNGWWRYFMTDGCEYMLSSDLQGCLDEIIDTILKKYGG